MSNPARYDEIANWYVDLVADWQVLIPDRVGDLLPPTVHGARVLDVACGHGRASRGMARLGAVVVGVDLSAELITRARAREDADPLGIRYHVADITAPDEWWDGEHFDGAVCEMAMMDIDDLAGTVAAVAATVRPGGWFAVAMVHPCFPGGEVGLSSWPPDKSYFDEGRWTSADHDPDGIRIRVGSSHRTVSTYLNALISAGFVLDRVVELPSPAAESVPAILLVRCTRGDASLK